MNPKADFEQRLTRLERRAARARRFAAATGALLAAVLLVAQGDSTEPKDLVGKTLTLRDSADRVRTYKRIGDCNAGRWVAAGQEGRFWCRASAPGGREEVKRMVAGWRGGIGEGRKGCRAPGTAVRHPGRAWRGQGPAAGRGRRLRGGGLRDGEAA